MVVVFGFHLFTYIKVKDTASKFMLIAIGVVATALFVFVYPVFIDRWFNHKDLAHIIMAISSLILLKSALLMNDLPKPILKK